MPINKKDLKDKNKETFTPTVDMSSIYSSDGLPFEIWLENRNKWKTVSGSPAPLSDDTKIIDIFKAAENFTFYYIVCGQNADGSRYCPTEISDITGTAYSQMLLWKTNPTASFAIVSNRAIQNYISISLIIAYNDYIRIKTL